MARVALRRGESSTRHLHTRTRDVFFVMSGRLTITVHVAPSHRVAAYHALPSCALETVRQNDDSLVHRLGVGPGEVVVIEPGNIHTATNFDDAPCHFLCIEGVGDYDFVPA